jgi:integrase
MTKRRKRLTDLQVAALPVRTKTYFHSDEEMSGHYIRTTAGGAKSYVAIARDPNGKQVLSTIGSVEHLKIDEARERGRTVIRRIKDGLPAKEKPAPEPDSYAAVADNWLTREIEKKNLITEREIKRVLSKYILPTFGDRPFTAIKRSDISALMDKIEDRHGPRMADVVLSNMRAIADWYAKRDDNYVTPFVRKMRRSTAKPRDRILTDAEIKSMWEQTGETGTWGAFLRMLLLTAQRADVVRKMRWSDLHDDNGLIWTIPVIERAKGTAGRLRLSDLAVDIIRQQPRIADNPFVFAGARSDGPFAIGKMHRQFSSRNGWTFHDLRRTARSLLTRLRIERDVAEAVLGHRLTGVQAVYDRHDYFEEKGHALAALANLITEIVHGTPDKVITLRQAVRR